MLLAPQLMTASFALVLQRGPIAPAVMRTAASPTMKIPQRFAQPAMAALLAATIAFAPIDAVHAAAKKSGGGGGGRPNIVQTKSGIKTVPAASASKAAAPSPSASTTAAPSASASDSKTGGRVGGRAPAPAAAPVATAAAAPAAPSVTNVIIQQPMQPMGYGGGMGYGQPMGGGGGGGMGLLIGVELAEAFVKEQQRAAMLKQQLATQQQLGADQAPHPIDHIVHHTVHYPGAAEAAGPNPTLTLTLTLRPNDPPMDPATLPWTLPWTLPTLPEQAAIQGLQRQLAEQSAKVDQLAAQKNNPPAAAPAAAGATEEQLKMQLQLMQNQKDLDQLRAAK